VLLAIAALFREYRKKAANFRAAAEGTGQLEGQGGKGDLDHPGGRNSEYEISASVDAFFVNAGAKLKLEPATRVVLRQVVENDITGLIGIINHIAMSIYTKERLIPLILIDDLDKPDLDKRAPSSMTARDHDAAELRHRVYRFQRALLQQGISTRSGTRRSSSPT